MNLWEYRAEKKRSVSEYIRDGKTWEEFMVDQGIADASAIEFASKIPPSVLERQPDAFTLEALGFEITFDLRKAVAVVYRIEFLRQQAIRDAKKGKRQWEEWMVIDLDELRMSLLDELEMK